MKLTPVGRLKVTFSNVGALATFLLYKSVGWVIFVNLIEKAVIAFTVSTVYKSIFRIVSAVTVLKLKKFALVNVGV